MVSLKYFSVLVLYQQKVLPSTFFGASSCHPCQFFCVTQIKWDKMQFMWDCLTQFLIDIVLSHYVSNWAILQISLLSPSRASWTFFELRVGHLPITYLKPTKGNSLRVVFANLDGSQLIQLLANLFSLYCLSLTLHIQCMKRFILCYKYV